MKRYVFPLARLLRLRAVQEAAARDELSRAVLRTREAEARQAEETNHYDAQLASSAALRGSVFNLLAWHEAATRAARAVVDSEQETQRAHREQQTARERWVSAKQRRAGLEHLAERARAEHQRQIDAEAQSELDDLNSRRSGRTRSPGDHR